MCKYTWTFLFIKQPYFLFSVFSIFWGENFLVGLERKHKKPYHLFSFLPTQPNTLKKKKKNSHFLFKVFHPLYFTSKQTHPKVVTSQFSKKIEGLISISGHTHAT